MTTNGNWEDCKVREHVSGLSIGQVEDTWVGQLISGYIEHHAKVAVKECSS